MPSGRTFKNPDIDPGLGRQYMADHNSENCHSREGSMSLS